LYRPTAVVRVAVPAARLKSDPLHPFRFGLSHDDSQPRQRRVRMNPKREDDSSVKATDAFRNRSLEFTRHQCWNLRCEDSRRSTIERRISGKAHIWVVSRFARAILGKEVALKQLLKCKEGGTAVAPEQVLRWTARRDSPARTPTDAPLMGNPNCCNRPTTMGALIRDPSMGDCA
jgi:hypothetical protein